MIRFLRVTSMREPAEPLIQLAQIRALPPLPVPVSPRRGELLESYAFRLAKKNGYRSPDEVERILKFKPFTPGSSFFSHRADYFRIGLWCALGRASEDVFKKNPRTFDGNLVHVRRLCVKCAQTNDAYGRDHWAGWVCTRHMRWYGDIDKRQIDVREIPEVLAAERLWRRHLNRRGVQLRTPLYEFALECAFTIFETPRIRDRVEKLGHLPLGWRSHLTEADLHEIVCYPEVVKIMELLSRRSFLDQALTRDPRISLPELEQLIKDEVDKIFPEPEYYLNSLVASRVVCLVVELQRVINNVKYGKEFNHKTNVLQYWSGYHALIKDYPHSHFRIKFQ